MKDSKGQPLKQAVLGEHCRPAGLGWRLHHCLLLSTVTVHLAALVECRYAWKVRLTYSSTLNNLLRMDAGWNPVTFALFSRVCSSHRGTVHLGSTLVPEAQAPPTLHPLWAIPTLLVWLTDKQAVKRTKHKCPGTLKPPTRLLLFPLISIFTGQIHRMDHFIQFSSNLNRITDPLLSNHPPPPHTVAFINSMLIISKIHVPPAFFSINTQQFCIQDW